MGTKTKQKNRRLTRDSHRARLGATCFSKEVNLVDILHYAALFWGSEGGDNVGLSSLPVGEQRVGTAVL